MKIADKLPWITALVATMAFVTSAQGQPQSQPPEPIAVDTAEVIAAYDGAFAALMAGDLATAARGFSTVAEMSADGDRRAAARELGRLAEDLMARGLMISGPSGSPGSPSSSSLTTKTSIAEDDRPSAGRTEFVAVTTIASFYSGFVLDVLLDVDDFQTGALVVTAATAAGFTGSLLATRDKRITGGIAQSYGLGLGLGLSNGLLLASPLGADHEKTFLSAGLGGAAVGGAAGLLVGHAVDPTRAQAGFVGLMSSMGIATTGLGTLILLPDDSEPNPDTILLLLAAGLDAGAAAGLALAPKIDWSKSRSGLVSLGVFLGAVGGFGGGAIAIGDPDSDNDGRVFSAAILGGMWAGLGLSIHLTRDMRPDNRFAARESSPVTIVPTAIPGGAGIALAGSL